MKWIWNCRLLLSGGHFISASFLEYTDHNEFSIEHILKKLK